MIELEVRCCCNPYILIGMLHCELDNVVSLKAVRVMTKDGQQVDLELGSLRAGGMMGNKFAAVKSNDRPKEFWQNIAGFRELSSEEHRLRKDLHARAVLTDDNDRVFDPALRNHLGELKRISRELRDGR